MRKTVRCCDLVAKVRTIEKKADLLHLSTRYKNALEYYVSVFRYGLHFSCLLLMTSALHTLCELLC